METGKINKNVLIIAVAIVVLAGAILAGALLLSGGGGPKDGNVPTFSQPIAGQSAATTGVAPQGGFDSIEALLDKWCHALANGNAEEYLSLYPKEITDQMSAAQRAEFAYICVAFTEGYGKPVQITYIITDSESDWDTFFERADYYSLRDLHGKVTECRVIETDLLISGPEDWDEAYFDFGFIQMSGRWYLLYDEID